MRTPDPVWLLEATLPGRTLRLSSRATTISGVRWDPGILSIPEYEEHLDLTGGDDPFVPEISLDILPPGLDLQARAELGYRLRGSRARVGIFWDGETRWLVEGAIAEPRWGDGNEVATISIKSGYLDKADEFTGWPGDGYIIGPETWPTIDELAGAQYGKPYPWVLGAPSASPGYCITDTSGIYGFLVAGHRVASQTVHIVNITTGESTLSVSPVSVSPVRDGKGRVVSMHVGGLGAIPVTGSPSHVYRVIWEYPGGLEFGGRPTTDPMVALEWALASSGVKYDTGAIRALWGAMPGLRVGTWLDQRGSPLDWARDKLLSPAGIALLPGSDGMVPVILAPWAGCASGRVRTGPSWIRIGLRSEASSSSPKGCRVKYEPSKAGLSATVRAPGRDGALLELTSEINTSQAAAYLIASRALWAQLLPEATEWASMDPACWWWRVGSRLFIDGEEHIITSRRLSATRAIYETVPLARAVV